MQSAYWELKREMSNLHLVTHVQAELLRKLKTPAAIKKGKSVFAGNRWFQPNYPKSSSWSYLIEILSNGFDKRKLCSVFTASHSLFCLQPQTGQLHTWRCCWYVSSALHSFPLVAFFAAECCLCVQGWGVKFALVDLLPQLLHILK